jgi:hypothetical protein
MLSLTEENGGMKSLNSISYKIYGAYVALLLFGLFVGLPGVRASEAPLSNTGHCPKVTTTAQSRAESQACADCRNAYEAKLPNGSRVYVYDLYVIQDGSTIAHSPAPSKMICGEDSFRVIDPYTGRSRTFSNSAFITQQDNYMEIAIRPGEAMPWSLKRDLKLGVAHLKKVI